MEIDLEQERLDSLQYDLGLQAILKSSNLTNQSLSNSLVQSFNLFYLHISKHKKSLNPQLIELKDRAFSTFVKQIIAKFQSPDNISKETSSNSSKNSGDSHKETIVNLLDLLSYQPSFFINAAHSLNFLVLEVIFLILFSKGHSKIWGSLNSLLP